jgi:hypothetical protein
MVSFFPVLLVVALEFFHMRLKILFAVIRWDISTSVRLLALRAETTS